MHDEDENIIDEDGFQMSDDPDLEALEEINDFGLDEEDPDKDH